MTITTCEFNDAIDLLGTRDEAAEALGVSPRTLQRIRAGTYDVSPHNQAMLARALQSKGERCTSLARKLKAELEDERRKLEEVRPLLTED